MAISLMAFGAIAVLILATIAIGRARAHLQIRSNEISDLRADAAKFHRRQRLFDVLLKLNLGVALACLRQSNLTHGQFQRLVSHHLPAAERLEIASRGVNFDANIDVVLETLFGR